MGPRILVLDNYDSFVYNLVQYLGELGAEPLVHRCDALSLDEIVALDPDGVLISPGPGRPEDAGLSNAVIGHFAGRRPVFGVCLGHQCIGQVFGGDVVRADQVMHGKTSFIRHRDVGVFEGLPNPLEATRYHSLIVERDALPDVLDVTAGPGAAFPTCWRSRPRPTTASSWACGAASSTWRPCSSIPSRSSPSAVTTCCAR